MPIFHFSTNVVLCLHDVLVTVDVPFLISLKRCSSLNAWESSEETVTPQPLSQCCLKLAERGTCHPSTPTTFEDADPVKSSVAHLLIGSELLDAATLQFGDGRSAHRSGRCFEYPPTIKTGATDSLLGRQLLYVVATIRTLQIYMCVHEFMTPADIGAAGLSVACVLGAWAKGGVCGICDVGDPGCVNAGRYVRLRQDWQVDRLHNLPPCSDPQGQYRQTFEKTFPSAWGPKKEQESRGTSGLDSCRPGWPPPDLILHIQTRAWTPSQGQRARRWTWRDLCLIASNLGTVGWSFGRHSPRPLRLLDY
ncbi:hypothetical protein BDZ85DRAFT_246048 [Elsinoe ampelina]|uniref:Uncharacterized protein n=1 Tax=Elsinoe ampelina TaxID=302913 RepID=A0A6A6GP16_9PEZI|nr:hypothetical protein BDZ85DRAFT_246048 [Elsinoe ampelina]